MGRAGARVAGSVWLIWLLAAQGVIWTAYCAPGPCATGCPVKVEPVCGNDGRSYANSCVATCADVYVKHQGYCDGEKLTFISPVRHSSNQSTAGTAGQLKPNWHAARESAQVIHTSTINRFIDEGYVYRGRVSLSSMPVYVKESSAGSTVAAEADTTQSQQESSSSLHVAIIRVDNMGHMYGKTFSYDPKRFNTAAYPPFDPSGGPAAAAAGPAATAAAVNADLSSSSVSKASAPSPATPAPAAVTPPATTGSPTSSHTTAQPTPAVSAPAPSPTSTAALNTSSSSSSSSSVGKLSQAAPAAAPSAQKQATPAPAAPQPASASKAPVSLPPASQVKAPTPAPTAPSSAKTPTTSSSRSGGDGGGGGSGSGRSSGGSSSASGATKQQQSVEADTVAGTGSRAGPAAGFSNTPGTSKTAASADLSDKVHWGGGSSSGSSETGEILKPELGSYDNAAGAEQHETGATGSGTTAAADLAAGNSTAGSNAGSNTSNSNASSSAQPAAMAVGHPIVKVEGDESAPGGTVTTVTFASNDDADDVADSSEDKANKPVKAKAEVKPEPLCSPDQLVCVDKVTGTSRYFGTKPFAAKYMDQVPMVGKGRISGMVLYYNTTSGCLRGTQVMYNYVDHPTSYYTSVLLGSEVSKFASIVVKSMMLAQNESIIKAEVYAPKCVQYVKLFTNHNNTVLVGTHDKNATLFTPQRNKPDGMLVAIRGFQDKATYHPATLMTPAYTSPGVLKQLQFIWGATLCNCSNTSSSSAAAVISPAASSIALEASAGTTTSSSSSGRRLAQILQRAAASSSVVLDAEELEQLQQQRRQEWQRQRQLHKLWRRRQQLSDVGTLAADGLVDDPGYPPLARDEAVTSRAQQLYSSKPQTLASMLARATLGMDGNLPAYDGPNIHRMLSVITPDSREPCPVLTYPFNTLGQINAKAADGGFVCSGGLIAPDRVLTAGHCVWDDRDTQGPFEDLAFAPAQWKKDGKITAPLGKVDWDYVTLFEAYINDPDGEGLAYDVSVITLSKPVGQQLGYLGIRADPSPCTPEPNLSLTLAGYPGDDPEYPIPGGWQGGCWYDVCQVNFSCSVSITNHTCDSYVGQSGAPMYDKQYYIRAVHTLGVLPGFSTSNGAITIQKFILDNVMGYWKETSGFNALAPGSVGTGSFY